jgi:Carbohydrate binding module (family 6)
VIPGRVECAAYDAGGEGVAYHDSDAVNHGSGALNPADGTYLNEFRIRDGVDISYTKFPTAPGKEVIDNSPYESVTPPRDQLYVGWTEPGEWFRITVDVATAGKYSFDLLYTSNRGGSISLDVNGNSATGPIEIPTTYNAADPVAWRQWHHWNLLRDAAVLDLPAGRNVLTAHIVSSGNMNLAYFDFRRAAHP